MSTYAIGDVQGCLQPLLALLEEIRFDRQRDRLWFAGDLVNRGPHSLEVLRLVRDLGDRAVIVLGNHDLHLVAAAHGHRAPSRKDTLEPVLRAGDGASLVDWLRRQPLLHADLGFVMVHAGLPPQWSVGTARRCAEELQAVLRDDARLERYLGKMYGDSPRRWSGRLDGAQRLRYITNAFTRMRYVDADGNLELQETRPPGEQPPGLTPWFQAAGRRSADHDIVFGHWATLQVNERVDTRHRVHHLDTGCVWGGRLSAMRLEDRRRFSVPGLQLAAGR